MKTDKEPEVTEPRWASLSPSVTLRELMQLGSLLTAEDAQEMREAIEEGRSWLQNGGQEISD